MRIKCLAAMTTLALCCLLTLANAQSFCIKNESDTDAEVVGTVGGDGEGYELRYRSMKGDYIHGGNCRVYEVQNTPGRPDTIVSWFDEREKFIDGVTVYRCEGSQCGNISVEVLCLGTGELTYTTFRFGKWIGPETASPEAFTSPDVEDGTPANGCDDGTMAAAYIRGLLASTSGRPIDLEAYATVEIDENGAPQFHLEARDLLNEINELTMTWTALNSWEGAGYHLVTFTDASFDFFGNNVEMALESAITVDPLNSGFPNTQVRNEEILIAVESNRGGESVLEFTLPAVIPLTAE